MPPTPVVTDDEFRFIAGLIHDAVNILLAQPEGSLANRVGHALAVPVGAVGEAIFRGTAEPLESLTDHQADWAESRLCQDGQSIGAKVNALVAGLARNPNRN